MPAKSKPTHRVFFLVVEGRGDFPIDMLRYDSCAPVAEVDSNAIARTLAGPGSMNTTRVALKRFAPAGLDPRMEIATTRRWESFGWKVVGVFNDTDSFEVNQMRALVPSPVAR